MCALLLLPPKLCLSSWQMAVFPDLRLILFNAGAQERVTKLVRPFVGTPIEMDYSDLTMKLSVTDHSDSD